MNCTSKRNLNINLFAQTPKNICSNFKMYMFFIGPKYYAEDGKCTEIQCANVRNLKILLYLNLFSYLCEVEARRPEVFT